MLPSPDTVKQHLAARIRELARLVAPNGKVEGREWVGHGPDGAKWGIVLYGQKIGHWQAFGSGDAGQSCLSLIRDAFCGGDHREAWKWAIKWLGEDAEQPPPKRPPAATAPQPPQRNAAAIGLYLHATPFDWDGPVGSYLQSRAIQPQAFSRLIGALRFHPSCFNAELRTPLPAMVAAIVDPITRKHIATHRTYLQAQGGRWRKAKVPTVKKVLGPALGGVIPLTRGASGRGIGQAPPGDQIIVGEGIENTLTVAQFYPERRALAYVSAGNLAGLDLPEQFADVMLVRDRDGENLQVERVRQFTIAHWLEEGRRVTVWEPPPGHKDANDYWQREAASERV